MQKHGWMEKERGSDYVGNHDPVRSEFYMMLGGKNK